MRAKVIKSLYKKEMLDVLRDKKTVIMMIIVPLILYPIMMIVGFYATSRIITSIETKTYNVEVAANVEDELTLYLSRSDGDGYSFKVTREDKTASDTYKEKLEKEEIDVYIEKKDNGGKRAVYNVYFVSSIANSGYALDNIRAVMDNYTKRKSEELVKKAGLDPDYVLEPVELKTIDESSSEKSVGNLMGSIVPFMLIISLLMGTMYPAIDTTAGERERGTLETMLTMPISNQELIVSKFLTVATIGIMSAVLNVISMGGISFYMYKMIYAVNGQTEQINMLKFVPAIIVGVLCVFAFAVFISAITMCVCAFARTYKEANNYITPLMLAVMFASFVGLVPNIELNSKMALFPVANVCLLVKNMLVFKFDIGIIAIVLATNVAYGILAVLLLGKIYNSEGILFGDSLSGVKIFEKRDNIKKGGDPAIGDVLFVMAITVVLILYLGSAAQLKLGTMGVLVTQFIIIGVPVLAAWYTRCNMKKTFRLSLASVKQVIGGIITMLGTMLVGIILSTITSLLFKSSAQNVTESMNVLMSGGFVTMLFITAVAPAICEELMFRGYILSALNKRYSPVTSIVVSSIIFGLYHMSVVRFFTTALLGAVLAYTAYKTRSIIPGMIMHFMNNAIACVQMYYPQVVVKIMPVFAKSSLNIFDIVGMLMAGILIMGIGFVIINWNKKIIK